MLRLPACAAWGSSVITSASSSAAAVRMDPTIPLAPLAGPWSGAGVTEGIARNAIIRVASRARATQREPNRSSPNIDTLKDSQPQRKMSRFAGKIARRACYKVSLADGGRYASCDNASRFRPAAGDLRALARGADVVPRGTKFERDHRRLRVAVRQPGGGQADRPRPRAAARPADARAAARQPRGRAVRSLRASGRDRPAQHARISLLARRRRMVGEPLVQGRRWVLDDVRRRLRASPARSRPPGSLGAGRGSVHAG